MCQKHLDGLVVPEPWRPRGSSWAVARPMAAEARRVEAAVRRFMVSSIAAVCLVRTVANL